MMEKYESITIAMNLVIYLYSVYIFERHLNLHVSNKIFPSGEWLTDFIDDYFIKLLGESPSFFSPVFIRQ